MPLYEYECPRCRQRFELIRKMSERDDGRVGCNRCETPDGIPVQLTRVDTAPASVFPGAGSWR